MTPRRDLVGALASKDVDAIYRAVFLTVRSDEPDKDEIVVESVMAIHKMLSDGVPAKDIARQFYGIIRNHGRRVHEREGYERRGLVAEEEVPLLEGVDARTEPGSRLSRLEEFDEKIATLMRMRVERPDDFARLLTQYRADDERDQNGGADPKIRQPDAVYSADYRARQQAKKMLQQTRKDASS
jgi:hypothetical protein